jgi:predicted Zn-dependent protease
MLFSSLVAGADIRLPELGDSSSSVVSLKQERDLGRAWLMAFRRQVRTYDDPLVQDYLERLISGLASGSELVDRNLQLVLVRNGSINAFAVPGGIVGVHTGLLLHARTEHQCASVLTHELAHLSQRHFARRVESQRQSTVVGLTGLLAGLVLAATGGAQAGMAVMATSQAAMIDQSLIYSRQNEQEADRIGLDTLYRTGMNPAGAAEMFEQMLAATRYTGQRPPEFMLTHPLTESRVSDIRARVTKYPLRQYPDNLEYHLMRARIQATSAERPELAAAYFRDELSGSSLSRSAARYGLALAQSAGGDHDGAREQIHKLLAEDPVRLTYQLTAIAIERAAGATGAAIEQAQRLAATAPDHYPVRMELAQSLRSADRVGEAEAVLAKLSRDRPNDPHVWFELAEVSGLAGDIPGVHMARAEYFMQNGIFDKARDHLRYARKLQEQNFRQIALIDQRLQDLEHLERQLGGPGRPRR